MTTPVDVDISGWPIQPDVPYKGRDDGSPLNSRPAGSVWLSGTPEEDEILTVNNNLTDADTLGTFSYLWTMDGGAAAGPAAGATYTCLTADVGKVPNCTISYTDGSAQAESKISTNATAILGTGTSAAWQLDLANYIPAKFPLLLTYPRPDTETNSDAYCRNAYNDGVTSLAWEIPVKCQGGAWPFKYTIDATSAGKGISVGETLTVSGDEQIVGDAYGNVSWSAPTVGTHSIVITVEDQEGTTVSVTIALVVGSTGHVFIDSTVTDDTGTGAIGDPYKTFNLGLYANSHGGEVAHFKNGTYTINSGTSGVNTTLSDVSKPRSYVAYPGESPVFDVSDASFWTNGAIDDLFIGGDITYDGTKSGAANPKAINIAPGCDRWMTHRLKFTNVTKGTSGTDNPCCIVCLSGTARNYGSVNRCELGLGTTVALHISYRNNYLVLEHNTADGITIDSGNGGYFLRPKVDNTYVSVRANSIINATFNGEGVYSFNGGGTSNHQESCWNLAEVTSASNVAACERWNVSTGGSTSDNYSYRNTLINAKGRGMLFYNNSVSNSPVIEGNAVQGVYADVAGSPKTLTSIIYPAPTDWDANGKLTGSARTSYLGTYGHEVA